jgi:hypothetical protein
LWRRGSEPGGGGSSARRAGRLWGRNLAAPHRSPSRSASLQMVPALARAGRRGAHLVGARRGKGFGRAPAKPARPGRPVRFKAPTARQAFALARGGGGGLGHHHRGRASVKARRSVLPARRPPRSKLRLGNFARAAEKPPGRLWPLGLSDCLRGAWRAS